MPTRPRPWTAHRVRGAYQIEDANGDYVCAVPVVGPDDPDAKDDAELIARAVSVYEQQREACQMALAILQELPQTFDVNAAVNACIGAMEA